jgi:hypothetical protein
VPEARNLKLGSDGRSARAAAPNASFFVEPSTSDRRIGGLTLRVRPSRLFPPHAFLASPLVPADEAQGSGPHFILKAARRGVVEAERGDWVVRWRLAWPASLVLVDVPEGAEFRLVALDVAEQPPPPGALARAALGLASLAMGLAAVLAAQALWPAARLTGRAVRGALLALVACGAVAVLFLLPPFQGPDEWIHWKTALALYRPGAEAEPALYFLPDALDPGYKVRFRPENPFEPDRLFAAVTREGPRGQAARVAYANPLTYPAVGAVGLLFPRVETTAGALVFYYLCRAVPAAALLGLWWYANRAGVLGYTGLVLFSAPVVLQQATVVTPDTVPLLGAVLAGVLFAARWRRPDGRLTAGLWAACLLAAAAKPPFAGLLLLPLVFLPWRKLSPRLAAALAAGAVAAAALAVALLPARYQTVLLDPGQASAFLGRTWELLTSPEWLTAPFEPLGWLDTYLNPRHRELVLLSAGAALLLDAAAFGPALLRGARAAPGRALGAAAALLAAVVSVFLLTALPLFVEMAQPDAHLLGFQPRYLLPAAALAVMLPLALDPDAAAPGRWRPVDGAALAVLPLLFAARLVELARDLLFRYW